MKSSEHTPLFWGVAVVLAAVLLWLISTMFVYLWAVWRTPEPLACPPPYDWRRDDGFLDVLAREAEGEVLAVFPAEWLYR